MKIILVSALLVLSTWGLAQNDAGPQGPAQKKESHPARNFIGRLSPDFELPTVDGRNLKLSDLRGQVVLINFWATYCGTCKVEMPWFVELQSEYGPQGFQIVGVAMDDASTEDIAKFAKEMNVSYPVLIGNESVAKSYDGVSILPMTFFLDRDGKVIAREFGLQNRRVYVDHIKKALSQGQAVQ